MTDIEQIVARERIREVKARYCRFLDTKDFDGLAGLFTEDAILDVSEDTGHPPFHGRPALIETIRAAVTHAQSAHHVHTPEIAFDGEDAADVIWAMQDRVAWEPGKSPIPPAIAITGYGHYRERYVRRGENWLIASLKLTRLRVEQQFP